MVSEIIPLIRDDPADAYEGEDDHPALVKKRAYLLEGLAIAAPLFFTLP